MTSRVEKKSKKNKTVAQLSEPMQACSALLKTLKAKPNASPFLEPVDWQKFGLPDYPEIITKPMDLGTITTKLEDGQYILLIYFNCFFVE
jgi:bromodomain-containing factor 1